MASNNLPDGVDDLFTLAERNCDGLATHQATIGILQRMEVTMHGGGVVAPEKALSDRGSGFVSGGKRLALGRLRPEPPRRTRQSRPTGGTGADARRNRCPAVRLGGCTASHELPHPLDDRGRGCGLRSRPLAVSDSDATLTGLTSGATVRVRVTAVNETGESQPGEVKEMVVP